MALETGTKPTTPMPLPRTDIPTSAPAGPVKVMYIGGQGRSGSTLLGRLLGDVPGFLNVGELRSMWLAYKENRLCGCGTPIKECPFWTDVIDDAFGGPAGVDAEALLSTKRSLERIRTMPRLFSPFKSAEQKKQLRSYNETLEKLYASVRSVSGAAVIVDGSKAPMYSFFLHDVSGLDLRLIHLVRDSRAVAYSWQRKKLNPAIHWKETHFQPVAPHRVAVEWAAKNLLIEALTPRRTPHMFLRYEQAVQEPVATVERLAKFMDEPLPEGSLEFLREPTITLSTHHTVTGNPDRFQNTIKIKADAEWQEKMNPKQRAIVTALTYPLLAKYGYGK